MSYESYAGKKVILKSISGVKVIGTFASMIGGNIVLHEAMVLFPTPELNNEMVKVAEQKDVLEFETPVIIAKTIFRR